MSAFAFKSSRSMFPFSSLLTTTTFMPHMDAEAGLVPGKEMKRMKEGGRKDRMEGGKEERRVAQDSKEKINYGSIAEKIVRRKVQNE